MVKNEINSGARETSSSWIDIMSQYIIYIETLSDTGVL